MIRLSVRWPAILPLAALTVVSGGCGVFREPALEEGRPPLRQHFDDQTPAYVDPGALDSVVLIYDAKARTLGSGTVIAPDRVLTAAHVIDGMTRDGRGKLVIEVDGRELTAVVEAAGDPDLPHGDWALLAFERAIWTQVAIVHEPARTVGWVPPNGAEILLVGYASGFFDLPEKAVNVDAPTPCVLARIENTDPGHSAWYAKGDLVDLKGMSGGAAMWWNRGRNRAELIGIFRGYVGTETVTTEQTKILGVVTSERERTQPGIAFTIHRLPQCVTNPGSGGR